MARSNKPLMGGWAILDVDYPVSSTKEEATTVTTYHIYRAWFDMLRRVKDSKFHVTNPSYEGVAVADDWRRFSMFQAWAEPLFVNGFQLDKDIIKTGNKLYCPEFCAFVPPFINKSFVKNKNTGQHPFGVYFKKQAKKFCAQGYDFYTRKRKFLGYFTCDLSAHKAWQEHKISTMTEMLFNYEQQVGYDSRVGVAIKARIAKIENDFVNGVETNYF